MERVIETVLIESDFEGRLYDICDCVGYRAFTRTLGEEPHSWGDYRGYGPSLKRWGSYMNGKSVSMMTGVKVGDKIKFKEIQ